MLQVTASGSGPNDAELYKPEKGVNKPKLSEYKTLVKTNPGRKDNGISSVKSGDMEKVQSARLITAIKTPYTCTGRIDLNAYDKLVQFQVANGVQGIVVGGTTGEGHLMNWEEHLTLIEHSADKWGD